MHPAALALLVALLAGGCSAQSGGSSIQLSVNTTVARYSVDELYVNFNIDTGSLYNGLNFSDTKLRVLTRQLGPGVIRIGGTAVDSSFYFPSAPYNVGAPNQCQPPCPNGSSDIGNEMLNAVVGFVQATNMSLLWDMNGESFRSGSASGPWNPNGNGTQMLTYLNSKYAGQIDSFAYSVGNEPDLWHTTPSPQTLAGDAVILKKLLANFNIGKTVAGPSYARVSSDYASGFLPVAAKGGVDFFTVHNYPYGGHDCVVDNYLDKTKVTSNLGGSLASVRAVADKTPGGNNVKLVLEEVAGSSGGGCENVTDRFLAGLAWMNTLNTVAVNGFARVHRQDIVGWSFAFGMSHYMLVGPAGWVNDTSTLYPHPDYFTTILWKQLVGSRILSTQASGSATNVFEGHFWCTAANAPGGTGNVVLAWTNSGSSDLTLQLPSSLSSASAVVFTLTATPSGTPYSSLQSDDIYLNGNLLAVNEDGSLPVYPIPGLSVSSASKLVAPAYSYGFIVFNLKVAACA